MENKLLHNPTHGKLRVLGYASGSGNTLWKALELQRDMEQSKEGCPFEIVGVFSDKPGSKAVLRAKQEGIPHVSLDIREFHAAHKAPMNDMKVRALFDQKAAQIIEPLGADMILLAGYVWATTESIVNQYLVVNVHPADLSVLKEGTRVFAGGDGVGDTLKAKMPDICSSAHIATSEVDGGPLLMRSPSCTIDYNFSMDNLALKKEVLKKVNEQSRNLGAIVVLEIAQGKFSINEDGTVCHQNKPVHSGVKVNNWEENKPLFQRSLKELFSPESVAVIGASAKGGIGNALLNNIINGHYTGKLYVVNRSGEAVHGVRAYTSMEELPDTPDMVVITAPSAGVAQAVEDCGKIGVQVIACISAGFKETGEKGAEEELKIKAITDRFNMRLIGPNGMGVLNTDPAVSLNATMLHHQPERGNIAFFTQSGAMGAVLLDYAGNMGMGFSKIASLGNLMDIDASDLLSTIEDDPNTEVVLMYVETLGEGHRFLKKVKQIAVKKPVVVLKSGRSDAGAAAASSHTGSIAGSDQAVDALLEKAGAIRVDTLEMAYFTAMALSKVKPVKGKRIGVVTNAGGPGILIADRLASLGFEMPFMTNETRETLANQLFPEASTANPVDIIAAGPPEHYALALKTMAESGLYDALALVCVPPATIDTGKVAEAVVPVIKDAQIPVISCFMGPTLGAPARKVLNHHHLPCVEYPETAADLLRNLQLAGQRIEGLKSSVEDETQALDEKRKMTARRLLFDVHPTGFLKTNTALNLLALYGIQVPAWRWVKAIEEAENCDLSYPLVAKIEHEEIIHKSDVGGVVLSIQNNAQLQDVVAGLFNKFPGAEAVLLQEQAKFSHELILGAKFEDTIGHLCLVGTGGTLVELNPDVSLRLAPIREQEAWQMLKLLKSYPLLDGYRGGEKLPVNELADMMAGFSTMLQEIPAILEIDLNPVAWDQRQKKFMALDCRIRM